MKHINFNEILTEWSYKLPKGYPTVVDGKFVSSDEVIILNELLQERGIDSIELPQAQETRYLQEDLEGTNTPDFKEGLVIYFTAQSSQTLKSIEKKLQTGTGQLKLSTNINKQYYGSKAADLVQIAIAHLSKNELSKKDVSFYNNALSIAKAIQDLYKRPVQADRGIQFESIRKKALELVNMLGDNISLSVPDKWCPADIYIYNTDGVAEAALSAQSLNIGKTSLNSQFQSKYKETSEGILGISLKEEKAQAGKATSFKGVLDRDEDYPEMPVDKNLKLLLETTYNLGQSLISKDKKLAIGYFAVAYTLLNKIKIQAAPSAELLKTQILQTLTDTLGEENLSAAYNRGGSFDKDKTRKLFAQLNLTDIKVAAGYESTVKQFYTEIKQVCENKYNKSRDTFINTLKEQEYQLPENTPDTTRMSPETLLKKASCYDTAEYIITGMNTSDALKIPPGYQTIAEQKNAFVALTAYAIGMAGISPTFVKMVGNSKGAPASIDTFYGSGFLNLDEEAGVKITDTTEYKGFYVEFITKVTIEADEKAAVQKRYSVALDFRYAGDQLNIEVSELKQA
jgi:hypothetical protein